MNDNEIALRLEHLEKRYGDLVAVDDLNLEIYKGEIFGFLGPNGAGKTTSINMICGILKADKGNIYINGDKHNYSTIKNKSKVGICPQEIIIWNKLTCFEQLLFIGSMYDIPRKICIERAEKLLSDMKLSEKKNKLASTLSGGMQRRLNLIMALMHDPEIIVLDEPEAGLDPQSRVMVRDYIKSLSGIKTVIFTTHNMDEAERICKRIAIIDRGKLLLTDTIENLKKNIGEGDVLEIEIVNGHSNAIEKAIESLLTKFKNVQNDNSIITIREKNIIEDLPEILSILKTAKVKIDNIKLRENTLEDVFISLTGRRLRE